MTVKSTIPSPFTRQSVPKASQDSASTYARNYWGTDEQLGGISLHEWIRRASSRAHSLLSRQQLILFLESSAQSFRNVDPKDAEDLGALIGRLQGAGPIEVVLRSSSRAAWVGAFVVGVAKTWRKGLSVVASAMGPTSGTFVPALSRCLQETEPATRIAALSALTLLAVRGDLEAFRAVERRCLAKDVDPTDREQLVRGLFESGTAALKRPATSSVLQNSVDTAVALIDVAAKTEQLPMLDAAFLELDPAVLPIEVSVAMLASSRPLAQNLRSRHDFVGRFATALRTRRHPDTDKLLRYAK